MAIFIGNIFFICLYWFMYNEFRGNKRKTIPSTGLFVFFIALQMILLLALRAKEIGIDTHSYYGRFYKYADMSWGDIFADSYQEVGFSILIKLIGSYTENYQWLLAACAVLTIVPISIVITKYSPDAFLSFLLFICFGYFGFMFSGIRQGLAIGMLVYSYRFIREKKLIPFLIVVFLASQFHHSAIAFLPAYFIAGLKIDKYSVVFWVALWVLTFAFKNQIYDFMEKTLFSTVDNIYKSNVTGAYMWNIMMTIIAIIGIIANYTVTEKNRNFEQFVNLMSFGAILTLFTSIGGNAKRLSEYYCVFLIFLIPGIKDRFKDKTTKKIICVLLAILVIGMFAWSFTVDEYRIIPYKFYFE